MSQRKQKSGLSLALILLGTALAGSAQAHHRDFTFLRDWYLPYKGEREIESRTSIENKTKAVDQEVEFELGITDHFAIEPGIAFHQEPGEKTHIDAWDVELRFNFLDFEYNKLLPALNIEYENPSDPDEAKHGELKFIGSVYTRQGEDFSINLNIGQELNKGKEKEAEILLGYVRPLTPFNAEENEGALQWRGGLEFQHDFQEQNTFLGPVLVCRVNKHLNAVATYMFAMNHKDAINDLFKFILEWEF